MQKQQLQSDGCSCTCYCCMCRSWARCCCMCPHCGMMGASQRHGSWPSTTTADGVDSITSNCRKQGNSAGKGPVWHFTEPCSCSHTLASSSATWRRRPLPPLLLLLEWRRGCWCCCRVVPAGATSTQSSAHVKHSAASGRSTKRGSMAISMHQLPSSTRHQHSCKGMRCSVKHADPMVAELPSAGMRCQHTWRPVQC